jgi:putative chitinase
VNFPVPCEKISEILGMSGPLTNVAKHWPLVESALDVEGIYSPYCAIAAIATISVEAKWFCPMKKNAAPSWLTGLYENRQDLGNVQPGDGVKFLGRGFIPIVGRRSYTYYGRQIGADLADNPDLALNPAIAAAIFALYFKDRGVRGVADQQNWTMVRLRVHSDLSEWKRFFGMVLALLAALGKQPAPEHAIADVAR